MMSAADSTNKVEAINSSTEQPKDTIKKVKETTFEDNNKTISVIQEANVAFQNKDYEAAVTLYAEGITQEIEKLGDQLHLSLGPIYFAYGKALMQLAIANGSLGLVNKDAVDYNLDAVKVNKVVEFDQYEDEDDEEATEEENSSPVASEEEKENEDEGDDESVEEDDFELAWKVFELARLVYSQQDPPPQLQIAEVLQECGDLSMERENFTLAASDYSRAAEILDSLQANKRERASLQFKIGIALEFEGKDLQSAKSHYQKAKELLQNLITENKAEEKDEKETIIDDNDLQELQELITEVESKITELDNGGSTAISLKEVLMEAAKEASSATASQVNDLTYLIKKRKAADDEQNHNNKEAKND